MRTPIAAGNWKMNLTPNEAWELARSLSKSTRGIAGVDVLLFPPFVYIPMVLEAVKGSEIRVGAQNMHWEKKGAFTGEVSGVMLCELGCKHCIIGHSERRQYFGETDESVNKKVKAALELGLSPVVCVGETEEQRDGGRTGEVVRVQVEEGLKDISSDDMKKTVVAYEPVWAIGTGRQPKPEEAEEVHAHIRSIIKSCFSDAVATELRILYGGSVKSLNIEGFMEREEIDGALVGGASLEAQEFLAIIEACAKA